jgi:hypothetical protein
VRKEDLEGCFARHPYPGVGRGRRMLVRRNIGDDARIGGNGVIGLRQ